MGDTNTQKGMTSYVIVKVVVDDEEAVYVRSNFSPTFTASIIDAFNKTRERALEATIQKIDKGMTK